MRLSIRTKLFITIFVAFALAVGGTILLTQFSFKTRFLEYVNSQEVEALSQLEAALLRHYQTQGNWQQLKQDTRLWRSLVGSAIRSTMLSVIRERRQQRAEQDADISFTDLSAAPARFNSRLNRYTNRVVLLDAQRELIRGSTRRQPPQQLMPLSLEGETIGYIGLHSRSRLTEKLDLEFSKRLQMTFWLMGLLVLIVGGGLAFILARHLVRPIQALRQGTRQLSDGDYSLRMQPRGRDELALLTHDFNQLAERLQQNEASRKQWIADIAHELRTPLSILRGEIEALQDGINQANPKTLTSLHQEVAHLQRLVDDLYDLSMSDSGALNYQMSSLDVIALLRETLALYGSQLHEQQLQVDTICIELQPVYLRGDAQRLQQLFKNLLENSLRYTNKPGQLRIMTQLEAGYIQLSFEDSAPAVPDEALPQLFERLFRVEASRNRDTGGSGIGLSICQNIVQAHGGEIHAQQAELGGLAIIIRLPITQ